jgi:ABC-type antimicrobial peptide transport system permease subunit
MQSKTGSVYKELAIYSVIGAFLGIAAGMGLSLLGVFVGARRT